MRELEMGTKSDYIAKINKIPTISFNKEQKEIAKKIIESTDEKDLDAVYGLITQRVKTGFVFDEAPEVNHNCVALIKENKKLNIAGDGFEPVEHKLIIGENYDALKNLCATYIDKSGKGLIDVIYIDPPYNTEATKKEGNDYKEDVEATKFVYRDKFTRDGWLNMMNERLKLAKRLLSDKGVIFISIDDTEEAYLKVLCDEVFGENNFVATVIWERAFAPINLKKHFSTAHDYVLIYAKNIDKAICNGLPRSNEANNRYDNPDNDSRGVWQSDNLSVGPAVEANIYPITTPSGRIVEPPSGYSWRVSQEKFYEMLQDNKIYFGKDGNGVPRIKRFLSEVKQGITPMTIWKYSEVGHSQDATKELKDIFGGESVFSYPKPVSLIKRIVSLYGDKSSIVLDFFAGSGTTGQAVMELNEEDGGKRQFILVTNNENNIGTDITRERLYRVIKGKGSKGEKFKWTYTNEKPYLSSNNVTVFKIDHTALTLKDLEKAEKIRDVAKAEFKKLNPNCSLNNDFDVYNELAALNPQKGDK